MEFLQIIQYLFIAPSIQSIECNNAINKFLTSLGFLHIAFQPYVMNIIRKYSDNVNNRIKYNDKYNIISNLCIVVGIYLSLRHLFGLLLPNNLNYIDQLDEPLMGNKLCTFKGNLHLAWSIPLLNPSYFVPNMNLHFFFFFIPQLVMYFDFFNIITTLLLFLSGPVFAIYLTSNKYEQASIWCLFSSLQFMILTINLHIKSKNKKSVENIE